MSYTGSGGAVNDLVLLDDVSEGKIVDCLRNHHSNREIYTYIGPVLISVNPYTNVSGLYGKGKIKKFVLKKEYENDPHVYAIAERAYRSMVNDLSNECVIITGESGAGKTEASKKVMEYIAAMHDTGPANSNNQREIDRVKNQLLESNPLLESFGNAKTVRNDNSSRFGKYMEILFLVGDPAGGNITTYLLEKNRVVGQLPGERNFHIFYEVLSDRSLASRYFLAGKKFNYICDEGANRNMDDASNFADTKNAMNFINIAEQEQDAIFRIVAFTLHLGNCDFTKGPKAKVTNREALRAAADCISVSENVLEFALTNRTVKSGIEEVQTPLNTENAISARDSMAKTVYNKLFEYVVRRANEAIKCEKFSTSIGVLDIYGFEILGTNGYNQLCINYTNERLHYLNIEKTLKAEQEEYRKEGIQWQPVKYFNNKPICDMIDAKGGLFELINDVSNFAGDDTTLFNKLSQSLKQKEFQVAARSKKNEFQIMHYAGMVAYCTDGFVETNKDTLYPDIVQCISASKNPVASQLFQGHQATRKSVKVYKKAPTASTQYKDNVNNLIADLSKCNQHYIRCIKPNDSKSASIFQDDLVVTQCRYLGLLENVKVRRAGYAFRMSYARFAAKYKCVLPPGSMGSFNSDSKAVTRQILSANLPTNAAYEMGASKVFIKEARSILGLEEKRKKFLQDARMMLPPEEEGLIFADRVLGVNDKFVKEPLTFCVGGTGFYWYTADGSVAQFFPMEKIEFVGYNDNGGWMTIHTSYPSKVEGETVHLAYLSENIYPANVENFIEVMHSMGYSNINANKQGAIPRDAVDVIEYKALVKQIAKGGKPTVQRGQAPPAEACCKCIIS